uniref:Uncharacterized protein MANES_02G077800 n=1 Tax=Rhizophora mucronata TaxID=61149 RepID=A0A2P2KDN0_RHIMU
MLALVPQENLVALVSRTGRHLQRYNKERRLVVGCIPYRYKIQEQNCFDIDEQLEVLVISSQKKTKGMLFPKVLNHTQFVTCFHDSAINFSFSLKYSKPSI